jgi:AmmeMemoRadiSam system protein B
VAGIRPPAVAGSFYDARADALVRSLRGCFTHRLGPGRLPQANSEGPGAISALVSPHAGYLYSGPAAAHGYAALAADGIPDSVVLLGPSHYTADGGAAVSLAEAWRTPLGDVPVQRDLCQELLAASDLLAADEQTHASEHSLEVQVPFLQFLFGDRVPGLVPICLRTHPWDEVEALVADARRLGEVLAEVVGARRVVVIASTDFSHQAPQEFAEQQDRLALDAILALDPDRLLRTVQEHRISTCGPIAVAVALAYCQARGGGKAELLRYYTSGDVIGEKAAVVGYASVVIRREGDVPL